MKAMITPIELSSFSSVEVDSLINIVFTQDEEFKVSVSSTLETVSFLNFKVHKNTLIITFNDNDRNVIEGTTVYISSPKIPTIIQKNYGNGNIEVIDANQEFLKIKKTSSGNLLIKGNCKKLIISQYGYGKIDLSDAKIENFVFSQKDAGTTTVKGSCNVADYHIYSAGKTDLLKLIAKKAKISKSGPGPCKVYASEEVNGSVSGCGSLSLYGKPAKIDIEKTGLCSVNLH